MVGTEVNTGRGARHLGFQSLEDEVRSDRLPVLGEVPSWLSGTLVRVTPAKLDIGGRAVGHWFDGLGMLNVFSFADGQVSYANRYLQTKNHREAGRGRENRAVTMGTDPCRHLGQRLMAIFDSSLVGDPNVNVARLGERYIAATESPVPLEFDPRSLATRGFVSMKDSPRDFHGTFEHAEFDADTGEMITYVTRIGLRNQYRIIAVAPDSFDRRQVATLPADRNPSYMHSFGMTERYIVLPQQPLRYSLPAILRSGKFRDGFQWEPERGARFVVVDRHNGQIHGEYAASPFFYWHTVNAFEQGDEIVLDLVGSDNPSSVWDLDLVKLRNPVHRPAFYGDLRRYRIPLTGGPVRREQLSDRRIEFPRMNDGRKGRNYRYAYAVAYRGPDSDWFDQLVKIDVRTGEVAQWSDDGCYPSEPVFAAAPGAESEDSGVILNVVLDSGAERSFLLVLDAATFEELGRAEVPHHIPFNFHQQYFD